MFIDHPNPSRNARKVFQINKKRPSRVFGTKMGRPTKHRRFESSHSDYMKTHEIIKVSRVSLFALIRRNEAENSTLFNSPSKFNRKRRGAAFFRSPLPCFSCGLGRCYPKRSALSVSPVLLTLILYTFFACLSTIGMHKFCVLILCILYTRFTCFTVI